MAATTASRAIYFGNTPVEIKKRDLLYPLILHSMSSPPESLALVGNTALLRNIKVTFLGKQKPSSNELYWARALAHEVINIDEVLGIVADEKISQAAFQGTNDEIKSLFGLSFGKIVLIAKPKDLEQSLVDATTLINCVLRVGGLVITETGTETLSANEAHERCRQLAVALSEYTLIIGKQPEEQAEVLAKSAAETCRGVLCLSYPALDDIEPAEVFASSLRRSILVQGADSFKAVISFSWKAQ